MAQSNGFTRVRLVLVLDIEHQPETDRPGLRRCGAPERVIDTHGELVREESVELRRVG